MTQEAVHSKKIFKGEKCGMALKFDLEKAYNRFKLDFFLKDTLIEIRFPPLLVNGILSCVSSSSLWVP